jgi:N6-L-threonylcarbamoyladenine synthase
MKVLGIESSADDSGVALIEAQGDFGPNFHYSVLGNEVASQHHAEYGGIYPNVAKNEHIKNLPLIFERLPAEKPDVIAVTHGPGLEPCLWAGINFAQKLATEWNVPVVGVNHLEGHIIVSLMRYDSEQKTVNSEQKEVDLTVRCSLFAVDFPLLALLISGGNTQLVVSDAPLSYKVVGKTRDDAVGEAYDKVARMLGLPYPGGPHVAALAAQAREKNLPHSTKLPRPMLSEPNLDFSFSGLKTAVLRQVEGKTLSEDEKAALCREFEDAVADVLIGKTMRAVEEYGVNTVVTGGGVSANTFIREKLMQALDEAGAKLLVCPPALSTDNALMIALAGYFHALKKEFTDPAALTANGNLKLG